MAGRTWQDIWRGVAEDLQLRMEGESLRGSLLGVPVECEPDVRVSGRHPEGTWFLPATGPTTRVRALPAVPPPADLLLDVRPHSGLWPTPSTTGDPGFDGAFLVHGGDQHVAAVFLSPALRETLRLTSGWRFVMRGGHVWAYVGRLELDPLPLASAMRGVASLAARCEELGERLQESAELLGGTRARGPWRDDDVIELERDGVGVRVQHACTAGSLETRAIARRGASAPEEIVRAPGFVTQFVQLEALVSEAVSLANPRKGATPYR